MARSNPTDPHNDYIVYLEGKTLKDLQDIKRSISREKYPERYEQVIIAISNELEELKNKQVQGNLSTSPQSVVTEVKENLFRI